MTKTGPPLEDFRGKNVRVIYSEEKKEYGKELLEKSDWLRLLRFLPFNPDYARKKLEEREEKDTSIRDDLAQLQSWGRECYESLTESEGSVKKRTCLWLCRDSIF